MMNSNIINRTSNKGLVAQPYIQFHLTNMEIKATDNLQNNLSLDLFAFVIESIPMRVPIAHPKFSFVQQVLKVACQKQQHAKNITVTMSFLLSFIFGTYPD